MSYLHNKKHLLTALVSLVLILSLNINAFASSSYSIDLSDCRHYCSYVNASGDNVDISNNIAKSESNITLDNVNQHYTKFTFNALYSAFTKSVGLYPDLQLHTKTDYKYSYYVRFGETSNCECVVIGFITFSNGNETKSIFICPEDKIFASNTWHKFEGSFTTPDMSGNVVASLTFVLTQTNDSGLVGNTFSITDVSFTVDSPLYGETIGTPDTDNFNDNLQNYDDLIGSLPKVDGGQINDLMNFDFGSFIDGMNFVRDMFDRTLMAFNFNSVLLFSLVFGLACLILGRKASK